MALFTQVQLSGLTINDPSSLQFGPDGRLYVAQDNGIIAALTVESDGAGGFAVTARENINLVRFIPNHDDDGAYNPALTTRQVTGILVAGTAEKPVMFVSSSDPRIGGGTSKGDTGLDTNSGVLSMLTKEGSTWTKIDLVIGLPRSEENHAVNGMQINPANGHILLTVGGNTNAGAPSQEFGLTPEYAYSSAIVDIDVDAILAMPSQTYRNMTYKYALPTVDDPTRPGPSDVVAEGQPEVFGGNNGLNQARLTPDSPVQIYATGFRNLYDIAVNELGQIFGIDNGGNPTWGGPPMYRQPDGSLGTTPTGEVTNAINDGNGSINKAPLHRIEQGYYGGHAVPIRANPDGAGLYDKQGNPINPLPADWAPVPASMANPVEGYYLPPGRNRADILPDELETPLNLRGEIAIFDGSVNGIDDYRANTFGGEMRGDLVAASLNDDSIYRIKLSADGTTVLGIENLTPGGVLGNGNALDVHVAPEDGPFAGTIWVASYGGGITILVPDTDGEPDPVNQDSDGDGLSNTIDPFPVDPTNGQSVKLHGGETLYWGFSQNEAHPGPSGIGNLGFTGIMTNRQVPYTEQYNPNRTIMGGAAAGVLMQDITDGTPLTNNQLDAYQFGVDIGSDVATYTVTSKINNPFDNTTPANNQSVGIFIGTGDQSNYVRLVAGAGTVGGVANSPLVELLVETNDVVVARHVFSVPVFGGGMVINAADTILLNLHVDPVAGTVTPSWTVSRGATISSPGTLFTGEGTPVPLTGALLAAIQGNSTLKTSSGADVPVGLAVGIIGTSEGPGAPFSTTWNSIEITSTPKPPTAGGVAELVVNPNGGLDASTYDPNTIFIHNLAESGSDLVQVVIDLSNAILPDGVFFDTVGSGAGGAAGKGFTINSTVGVLSGTATYQNGDNTVGYRQMTLTFNGFNPGESVGFSIDIDPDSMIGFRQTVIGGNISGAEMAGSRVTFRFADGSTTQADLFGSGIAQAEARGVSSLEVAPVISLQNTTSGNINYPAGDPTISVVGAPGATIRVQMMTVDQLSIPSIDPFFGNSATGVEYETVVLDETGRGSVSASLTPGRVLVVAAAQVDENGRAISAVSQELRIVQRTGVQPVNIEGTSASETLAGGDGNDGIDGKGGNDILFGLDGNDYLNGGAGNDQMIGGPGDDIFVVDSTGDVVVELPDEGIDGVRTTLSSYTLGANVENLTYIGVSSFTGIGNALDNVLTGGPGADRLEGLGGADIARGGLGNDTYVVENIADIVIELPNEGNDRILSQVTYTLPDNVETLQLTTSKAIDGTGNSLANTIIGNNGVNVLDGRGGADTLTGGGGDDVFVFRRGEANGDTITDFTGAGVSGGDMLRFVGYGTDARLTQEGNTDYYIIHMGAHFEGATERIRLTGVTNLTSADYSFVMPFNAPPSDITLSRDSVPEDLATGVIVAVLDTVDVDAADFAMFSLQENPGDMFSISGNQLLLAKPLDYEANASHEVVIRARDMGGNAIDKVITIHVTDVNDMAPVFTSPSSATVNANTTFVQQLTATDPDTTGETTVFQIDESIGNGNLFVITGNVLSFRSPAVYGSGPPPVYTVGLIASDGVNTSTQLVTVEVLPAGPGGNVHQLTGGDDNFVYQAGLAYNEVDGLGGNDTFRATSGNVILTMNGDALQIDLDGNGSVDFTIHNFELAVLTGTSGANTLNGAQSTVALELYGLAGNDTLTGGSGADRLDGGSGNDQMAGGAGDDTYVVDSTGDVVVELAGGGTDTVLTSLTSYTLGANVENLTYTGTGTGKFTGIGNNLANVLIGGSGADRLEGLGGVDIAIGGAGNDTYVVENTADVVIELANGGNDRVLAQTTYTLSDHIETLQLTTSAAINGTGNAQANTIIGNNGVNILDGRGGADVLTGGGGNDIFVFRRGEANGDQVTDFTGAGVAGGDTLRFVGYGAGATIEKVSTGVFAIHAGPEFGGAIETILLDGVSALISSDYVFM